MPKTTVCLHRTSVLAFLAIWYGKPIYNAEKQNYYSGLCLCLISRPVGGERRNRRTSSWWRSLGRRGMLWCVATCCSKVLGSLLAVAWRQMNLNCPEAKTHFYITAMLITGQQEVTDNFAGIQQIVFGCCINMNFFVTDIFAQLYWVHILLDALN